MAKGKKQKSQEPTKKQIAVSRREKEQRQKILIALGIVAALILGIALAGLYDQLVAKPSRPVAVVHGTRIRADDYQNRVRFERLLLDTRRQRLEYELSTLDPEDPANEFLIQYYQQLASQTQQQRLVVDRQTVDDLVAEELARQKAAEVGLSVSEDELNEELRALIAANSGYLTETQATAVASTAVAVTATAETFTATPEPTTTGALTVTLVTTATPEIPMPAPTPTPHIITQEEFERGLAAYLDDVNEQAGLSEADFRQIVKAALLENEVRQHFADQVPTEAEQINVSHIQSDTMEESQAALARLDAGEDFALVASEVSTDTFTAANAGELGWLLEGDLAARYGPEIEEAAFSLNPGEYSQPISSTVGVHIIMVNERDVRPLSDFRLQAQQQQAYLDWLDEARAGEGVDETLWNPDMAPPDPLLERGAAGLPLGGVPSSNR
jgi:parvulin-like peptidyl-prolyl isomerase